MRHALIVVAILLVVSTEVAGQQVPDGMKTYWNLEHGFQLHIPERWKTEISKDKDWLVDFWDPNRPEVEASVGKISDVYADYGETFAARFIATVAHYRRSKDDPNWTSEFVWFDRALFAFPLGFYAIWHETRKKDGAVFIVMLYYLRDDGTGRGLPSGRVNRTIMFFATPKKYFRELESSFHHMAGSLRFLKPSR